MGVMMNAIPLIGRILLAVIYLNSGLNKLGPGFTQTQQYMEVNGMSATAFWLTVGIFLELAGAVMVLLGVYARVGAVMLMLFMVPVTFIFHLDFADRMQMIAFMKNWSMIGGLVLMAYYGAGRWSLDRLWRK
jgi:putative oxidoreductase